MPLFSKETLQPGDEAPRMIVTTHDGAPLDLAEVYTKGPVVIYFYPKADTPGCTKQACNIRDNYSKLQEEGIEVLGVSTDSVDSQSEFQDKYSLPFTLIADPDRKLGEAFGTGSFMGLGYKRQTFLAVEGKIVWRDLSAKPSTQAQDVLDALHSMGR